MEFHSEAQKQCYEKVAIWMREMFGEQAMSREDRPSFGLVVGSALSHIVVHPWGDDDSTITAFSYVVTGAELTADLMKYLLQENDRVRFGAFSIDNEGDIIFSHTIVGSTCDKEELRTSVMFVAKLADDYDDKIVARFGGQRAADR
jgi:hypothetical protein